MDGFLGEIRLFSGRYAPEDWALCNGQTLPINQNEALFSLIGAIYGGDGNTNFAVPNLQARLAIGVGQGVGVNGAPLTSYNLGDKGGVYVASVSEAQLPAHSHTFSVVNVPSTAVTPSQTVMYAVPASPTTAYADPAVAGVTQGTAAPNMLSQAGASAPHDNVMPVMALTYIISLKGQYPEFNS
ncbi:MAG: phage tail protein [Alphaproteobacteria bacterium]